MLPGRVLSETGVQTPGCEELLSSVVGPSMRKSVMSSGTSVWKDDRGDGVGPKYVPSSTNGGGPSRVAP